MIYQNPQILYALFALAIPIIIHLFNFRKHEKIYFSSIRFLEEIKNNTDHKPNRRYKKPTTRYKKEGNNIHPEF